MRLTGEMRKWLGACRLQDHVLLWDVMNAFMKRYDLSRKQAGRLIGQWINETL